MIVNSFTHRQSALAFTTSPLIHCFDFGFDSNYPTPNSHHITGLKSFFFFDSFLSNSVFSHSIHKYLYPSIIFHLIMNPILYALFGCWEFVLLIKIKTSKFFQRFLGFALAVENEMYHIHFRLIS